MAEPLDVDARLAEGRPAVDNIGGYVWACHLLGYQNPDLTLHPAQVRDWYGTEDGLNLRALETDRAALESVATAAEHARQLQERQFDVLANAWQGRGGDASREFLLRHGEASAATAAAVHNAVDAFAALRDDLWRAIDDKVAAAVSIDDRTQAERTQWRAAAQTVTTGAGDRALASELVDQQVKPFVDNDIRSDWLTAMQKGMSAVAAAFDAATEVLTTDVAAGFEVPGDLGPSAPPPASPAGGDMPAGVAGAAPAGWSSPAPQVPSPVAVPPQAAPVSGPAPAVPPGFPASESPPAAPMPMSAMPALGEMGGGLPSSAGGLAGLGSQIADAIGGLLNNPDDALPDSAELDDAVVDGGDAESDADESTPGDDESPDDEPEEADDPDETEESAEEPAADCPGETPAEEEIPQPDPAPTPPPAPPPAPPPPTVEPPPEAEQLGAETPCEIAADELPQAGS